MTVCVSDVSVQVNNSWPWWGNMGMTVRVRSWTIDAWSLNSPRASYGWRWRWWHRMSVWVVVVIWRVRVSFPVHMGYVERLSADRTDDPLLRDRGAIDDVVSQRCHQLIFIRHALFVSVSVRVVLDLFSFFLEPSQLLLQLVDHTPRGVQLLPLGVQPVQPSGKASQFSLLAVGPLLLLCLRFISSRPHCLCFFLHCLPLLL